MEPGLGGTAIKPVGLGVTLSGPDPTPSANDLRDRQQFFNPSEPRFPHLQNRQRLTEGYEVQGRLWGGRERQLLQDTRMRTHTCTHTLVHEPGGTSEVPLMY